jgi:hypothetical protein
VPDASFLVEGDATGCRPGRITLGVEVMKE